MSTAKERLEITAKAQGQSLSPVSKQSHKRAAHGCECDCDRCNGCDRQECECNCRQRDRECNYRQCCQECEPTYRRQTCGKLRYRREYWCPSPAPAPYCFYPIEPFYYFPRPCAVMPCCNNFACNY